MEDRFMWTDLVSVFALDGVDVDKTIREMWGNLRKCVIYFIRCQAGQQDPALINDAQDCLLRYARLVEETWGMQQLMTHNLHTCLVHLPEQAKLCGAVAFAAEWWLERLMQVFKRVVKYRCTRYPETTAVQHWLTLAALAAMRLRHPDATQLLDEIRDSKDRTERSNRDTTDGNAFLLGALSPADLDTRQEVKAALESVDMQSGGDEMRLTKQLNPEHATTIVPHAVGPQGGSVRRVHMQTAKRASIKCGAAQVRIKGARVGTKDNFAFVPYVTEDEDLPASSAAAVADQTATAIEQRHSNSEDAPREDQAALAKCTQACRKAADAARASAEKADRTAGYSKAAKSTGEGVQNAQIAAQSMLNAHGQAFPPQLSSSTPPRSRDASAVRRPRGCANANVRPVWMLLQLRSRNVNAVKWPRCSARCSLA